MCALYCCTQSGSTSSGHRVQREEIVTTRLIDDEDLALTGFEYVDSEDEGEYKVRMRRLWVE